MRRFVLDFPYSNVGPSQLMPGENAECACQALRDIFEWLGGVPPADRVRMTPRAWGAGCSSG